MKISEILSEAEITKGPWGDKSVQQEPGTPKLPLTKPTDSSKIQQVSFDSVFGGDDYNAIKSMGYKWNEKPSTFGGINSEIPKENVAAIERMIGRKLYIEEISDMIAPARSRRNQFNYFPMGDADNEHVPEETVIFRMDDEAHESNKDVPIGTLFLANRTGANSYFRMWARLV